MALFSNLGVKLRVPLFGVLSYASAQSLEFLDLTKGVRVRALVGWCPSML